MRAPKWPATAHNVGSRSAKNRVITRLRGMRAGFCVLHGNLSELPVPRITAGHIASSRQGEEE